MKKTRPFEILAIVILAAIFMVYACITYLIKPISAEIDDVNNTITQKEADIKTTYFTVSSYNSKSDYLKELSKEIAPYSGAFYSAEKESTFLEHLSVNITGSNLNFISLSALEGELKASTLCSDDKTVSEVYDEIFTDTKLKKNSVMSRADYGTYVTKLQSGNGRLASDVVAVSMTLEVEGKYESAVKYIKAILSKGKNIICNSMTLDIPGNVMLSAESNPDVRLVVSLTFIRIPGLSKLCTVKAPEPLAPFDFPQDIIDGSYRNSENILTKLSSLL